MKKCKDSFRASLFKSSVSASLLFNIYSCGDPEPTNFLNQEERRSISIAISPTNEESFDPEKIATEDAANEIVDNLYEDYSSNESADENVTSSGSDNKGTLSQDAISSSQEYSGNESFSPYTDQSRNTTSNNSNEIQNSPSQTSSDSSSSPNQSDSSGNSNLVTDKELATCAKIHGVREKHLKIVGNQKNITLDSQSIIVAKLAGNMPSLDINLKSESPTMIAGVCFFLTGNQSKLTVNLSNTTIGHFFYIGRGNKSNGSVNINKNSAIHSNYIDLNGNQAALTFAGEGQYDCQSISLRGNKNNFNCQ